jgi:nucleoside-diphosphate-sugar epimerase
MRILVTGAAGFIGSHLSEHLVDRGHRVIGIDNMNHYYSPELKYQNMWSVSGRGIDFYTFDLTVDKLSNVLTDVEIVYHLAAQPGISPHTPMSDYLRNNILATQKLVDAVSEINKIKMFINISTSSVYGADAIYSELGALRPISEYGVTKLVAEQLAFSLWRNKEIPVCNLRLFSVYGPRERPEKLYPKLIDSILNDKEFPLHEGSEKHYRSYTYVDDAVSGMMAVLDNLDKCGGETFNIGSDVSISTAEGIRIIEEIMDKKAKIVNVPKRPGDQFKTQANINKAKEMLNYELSTEFKEGVAREIEWYAKMIHNKINLYQ